ncbi:MAG TPA: ATP-binding cassette domain-containing protein [Clostridia bacterium]|nr:ATP-binding cassette domain-containing protein [Clostridia bacterium]
MVRLNGVTKIFNPRTPDERIALDDVTLGVEKGEFITIIGSNGAGKSTLLGVIAGSVEPDTGTVEISGETYNGVPEYKRAILIGRVFQNPFLGTAPSMTVEENLALAAARGKAISLRLGVTAPRRESFRKLLADLGLGLEKRLNDRVGLLSGGQRQALTLLMAVMCNPQVLLLDEHTAALDPRTAEVVSSITDDLVREKRITTLMVTHNLEQALRHGNRLIMMDRGRVIMDVNGEKKKRFSVSDLLKEFKSGHGLSVMNDRLLLA